MRKSGGQATLGELIGDGVAKNFSLKDLPNILGEKMPELPKDRIGKHRLVNALRVRFGDGYMNIPSVKNILKEFDDEVELENIIRANRKGK